MDYDHSHNLSADLRINHEGLCLTAALIYSYPPEVSGGLLEFVHCHILSRFRYANSQDYQQLQDH